MSTELIRPTQAPASGPTRICFVCMGNICRSPTAEVVLSSLVHEQGRDDEFVIDSAGTGGWHVGADMDPRSRATLSAAGYVNSSHVGRQFTVADFDRYDLVIALDNSHSEFLAALSDAAASPAQGRPAIHLLRSFDPEAVALGELEVQDPYNGGPDGFSTVLAQIERACAGLLAGIPARV